MTNKEESDHACDPRFAAFLAVHLVEKILDDACGIVSSSQRIALNTGQPWCYQLPVNNKPCKTHAVDESCKAGSDVVNENKVELVANVVATSTPQKVTDRLLRCKTESSFIGQGDEELDMHQKDLVKSTSMFINRLFDMSEVERVIVCDDTEIIQNNNSEPNELLTQAITNIMDSYINNAFEQLEDGDKSTKRQPSPEQSEYSFLSDAYAADFGNDIAFFIHDPDDRIENIKTKCEVPLIPVVQISETDDENTKECMQRNDVARFESAFLTLNRDYEQCSDDGNVILDDPKGLTLQEVELLTADTSDENLSGQNDTESQEKSKELTAVSAVSAASKKSIISRCRTQGARLLACLRGWWRRKTPGKRREHQHRVPVGVRGLCPLSPDARRRAASLIDHRVLRSPSPSRSGLWKFNTVNEALVNSLHWKDYTFEVKPEECGGD